jgi:hypothetical protein
MMANRHTGAVRPRSGVAVLVLGALVIAGCSSGHTPSPSTSRVPTTATTATATSGPTARAAPGRLPGVPHFDHVVVVVLENKAEQQILGAGAAPFLDSLAASGAVLARSYAITHPSEPNYLALFSGSTQGLSDDSCPHSYTGPNLGAALLQHGYTFTGYSEDLPEVGFTGCSSGAYARKHNPWVNFTGLPSSVNQPMDAFPADPAALPTVSFVIPNLDNDMHDGSVNRADEWLREHLGTYARWATSHNSALVVTTDEDDKSHDNHIATIVVGARVRPGQYDVRTDHYGLLRTVLDSYDLPVFGEAATAAPITAIWKE